MKFESFALMIYLFIYTYIFQAKDDPEPDENIQSENTSITTPEMKMEVESERDPNENFEEVTPKEEKMDSSTLTDSTVKKEEIISEIKTEVKKEIVKEMKEEETNTNCSSTPEKSGTPKSLQVIKKKQKNYSYLNKK